MGGAGGGAPERTALTSIWRACLRSALAAAVITPTAFNDHTFAGAFAWMNSRFSTSSRRAKIYGPTLSASLPSESISGLSANAVWLGQPAIYR